MSSVDVYVWFDEIYQNSLVRRLLYHCCQLLAFIVTHTGYV